MGRCFVCNVAFQQAGRAYGISILTHRSYLFVEINKIHDRAVCKANCESEASSRESRLTCS
jgi:hypothetical protein